jgi:predicted dehydrogenase
MLEQEKPDFVDIITPPETHLEMCRIAAGLGIHIICQKPLAPTYTDSAAIVQMAREAGVRFFVHENWRWQPWYREIKSLIEQDTLGEVFSIYFRMRTGDGWPADAYLARQPFFRDYPRLLVYETAVHFLDVFRFLLGEIETVYARLRRLNPLIKGEDSGQLVLGFTDGATAILDANRYNESEARNPRYTFGEMRIDGSKGHLLLDAEGNIFLKPLGKSTYRHDYPHEDQGFAGDCVHALQSHFVEKFRSGEPFERSGEDYLETVKAMEACYASATSSSVVHLPSWQSDTRS